MKKDRVRTKGLTSQKGQCHYCIFSDDVVFFQIYTSRALLLPVARRSFLQAFKGGTMDIVSVPRDIIKCLKSLLVISSQGRLPLHRNSKRM